MATVTFTTAEANQPVWMTNGTVTKVQSVVTTATHSNGDVYVLANLKVPHGATITSVGYKGIADDGDYILEMGMSGSAGTLDVFGSETFSSTAAIALTQISTGLPYKVSVSQSATQRYHTLSVRIDGAPTSGTFSMSLQFMVQYYCP
jgi:hypothetical protein